jgi:hypothetical protein
MAVLLTLWVLAVSALMTAVATFLAMAVLLSVPEDDRKTE